MILYLFQKHTHHIIRIILRGPSLYSEANQSSWRVEDWQRSRCHSTKNQSRCVLTPMIFWGSWSVLKMGFSRLSCRCSREKVVAVLEHNYWWLNIVDIFSFSTVSSWWKSCFCWQPLGNFPQSTWPTHKVACKWCYETV